MASKVKKEKYTIDDINNLGAVKIRIRSLLEAVAEGEKNADTKK